MEENQINIKFENQTNPNSAFDLLALEELLHRNPLDHSPEKLHKVEFFMLILITEGHSYHTIDFTDYKIEKGTLLTIRKDQIHKFFKCHNVKGFLLLFTDVFLVSYLEKLESQKTLQLFNELLGTPKIQLSIEDYRTVNNIIGRIENEYLNQRDDYSLGIIRSELHILITKIYRVKTKLNHLIVAKKYLPEFIALQKFVENNAHKTNRVVDYAKMMKVSTKTLNTISKSIVNKTAKEFINDISIKQIKRNLINTTLSVKEIAYASGFEETTNFYKYFKRLVGLTPEQFRKNH